MAGCLIVETDDIWASTLKRSLALPPLKLESKCVATYEDALDELQRERYELVILDLSLDPDKQFDWGKNLLAAIKSMRLTVPPIIVVSGTPHIEDVAECLNDYREIVYHFASKAVRWQHLKFVEAVREIRSRPKANPAIADEKQMAWTPLFISHTGESAALTKLVQFLEAIKVPFIIAENEPKKARSVKVHVSTQMERCGAAILLKSKDTSRSVLVEQGQLEERFPSRVVYLVEEGTPEGPLEREQVHESYTGDNMERAFIFVARELKAFGYLGQS